jgi:hypothetical protein
MVMVMMRRGLVYGMTQHANVTQNICIVKSMEVLRSSPGLSYNLYVLV